MKYFALSLLLASLAFPAISQEIPHDSILPTIRYIEAQPFDTGKKMLTIRLLATVEKTFPPREGDQAFIITLGKNIKPPVIYFLTRAYMFGRAAYLYQANNPDYDSAKVKGIREVERLYRYMKQRQPSFNLPLLESILDMETSGRLESFTATYLNDSVVRENRRAVARQVRPFIHGAATDQHYGYTTGNPVKVGGGTVGARRELLYLDQLQGIHGEAIEYKRLGACCSFKTEHALVGDSALLDLFEIKFKGKDSAMHLYIDMYDEDTLYYPVGFKEKGN